MAREQIGRGVLAVGALLVSGGGAAQAASYSDIVKADGPALYWNFDEAGATANAVEQMAGDAANALVAEGTATRVPGTTTSGGAPLGNAFSVSGAGGRFFNADLAPTIPFQTYAIEFWMQNLDTVNPTNDYVVESFPNAPGVLFNYVGATASGKLELYGAGRTEGATVAGNGWHHVVIGYYGSGGGDGVADKQVFYVDGVLAATTTRANPLSFSNGRFAVGNSAFQGGLDPFTGNMDEVAIYNFAALQDENEITAKLTGIASHSSAVPEPGAGALLAVGLGAAALRRRRGAR